MAKKKTTEEYLIDFENKHGKGRYDYSLFINNGNKTKSIIICPVHKKQFLMSPNAHLNGQGCPDCKETKKKTTQLLRWGGHPSNSPEIKEKKRITNLLNRGVDNPSKSDEIKEKKRHTCLIHFNTEHPQQSEEIRAKVRATNVKRYGHENIAHGTKKEKIKVNKLVRFGCEHQSQQHMIESLPLLQSKEWLVDQYIVQKKTLTQIGKELGISCFCISRYANLHNIEIRPNEIGSSYQERGWIEGIMESEGIYIQYDGNSGQYIIPGTRYKADGYCAETNTIYEFHGSAWHGNPRTNKTHPKDKNITAAELYQKTKEREQAIIELGYNLVVMWDDGVTYTHIH